MAVTAAYESSQARGQTHTSAVTWAVTFRFLTHWSLTHHLALKIAKSCPICIHFPPDYFFCFAFCFFGATLVACGISPARGWIDTVAVGLHHNHSNARSELNLWPRPHLTHWARPGVEPASSWILGGFITQWATTGTPPITWKQILYMSFYL